MSRSVLPIELRPLRAILARLSERSPDEHIGPAIAEWCRREGLTVPADTRVHTAVVNLTGTFFNRAPGLMTKRSH